MVLPVETSHTCGWRLPRVREDAPCGLSPGRGSCPYPAGPLPQPLPSLSFLGKSPSLLLPYLFSSSSQESWPQKGGWAATWDAQNRNQGWLQPSPWKKEAK